MPPCSEKAKRLLSWEKSPAYLELWQHSLLGSRF